METHKETLINLIRLNGDIVNLKDKLNNFSWDSEESLYVMQKEDILNVFGLLSKHIIDTKTLEEWANAIECREDLEYESEAVHEVINELANPVLYGTLLPNRIEDLREFLK